MTVAEADRLDRALAGSTPGISRARFQSLITAGQVTVNGATIVEAKHRVKPGDRIAVAVPEPDDPVPQAEPMPLTIIHEDAAVIVIDKPAGLVVHPGPGNWTGTLVNGIIAHCGDSLSGIGGIRRPGIVHRIDKDTSGLLVVAKTDAAHSALSQQFAAHGRDGRLKRVYAALVWGVPSRRRGMIDAAIARHRHNRQKMAVSTGDAARAAVTHYEVREALGPVALVDCTLETGRTHQIRVHMSHIGHPILGDTVYGASHKASANRLDERQRGALAALDRQALHARLLGFEHPVNGKPMLFESRLPDDIQRLVDALR